MSIKDCKPVLPTPKITVNVSLGDSLSDLLKPLWSVSRLLMVIWTFMGPVYLSG